MNVSMKQVQVTVTDNEHERLKDVKEGRTWREAFLDEFGVEPDE